MRFWLAVPILAIAGAIAAPAFLTAGFARDPIVFRHHYRVHHARDYSGYMDPRSGHFDPEFQRNRENFGFSGRDPSRVGGEDPSLHPIPP